MNPVVIIRPEPGCVATVAAARALGLEAHGFPLFEIRALAWQAPTPDTFDALLIGSANALRQGGTELASCLGRPVYAVGQTTAAVARAAGFDVLIAGQGGLQALLADIRPEHQRLLRLTGELRVDVTPPPGVTIIERMVYTSEPQPMPSALTDLLQRPAIVLLHSGEAARHFAHLCDRNRIIRSQLSLAAIGPRVAGAAGEGWHAVAIAQTPDDTALLALAKQMCQTRQSSGKLQDKA